jgi:hypothetical protein
MSMNVDLKTPEDVQPLTGETREELRRMLQHRRLTAGTPLLERGATVKVVVGVWPSQRVKGQFDALLSAFSLTGDRLSLTGVQMTAEGRADDGESYSHLGRLTRRGDLAFDNLQLGAEYRLQSRSLDTERDCRSFRLNPPLALAAAPAGDSAKSVDASVLRDSIDVPSTAANLHGTVRRTASGNIELAVATRDPALAGATVHMTLVEEAGRVLYQDDIALDPVAGMADVWEARWEGSVHSTEPCTFRFELLGQQPEEETGTP